MTKTQYAAYLQSDHWKALREDAILNANSKCERCSLPRWIACLAYDNDLHVHHKTYIRKGKEHIDDLEALCRRCHELETFKRTELRAPKEATCSLCREIHYDYRANICNSCLAITGVTDGFWNILNVSIDDGNTHVWELVVQALAWEISRGRLTKNVVSILVEKIDENLMFSGKGQDGTHTHDQA